MPRLQCKQRDRRFTVLIAISPRQPGERSAPTARNHCGGPTRGKGWQLEGRGSRHSRRKPAVCGQPAHREKSETLSRIGRRLSGPGISWGVMVRSSIEQRSAERCFNTCWLVSRRSSPAVPLRSKVEEEQWAKKVGHFPPKGNS